MRRFAVASALLIMSSAAVPSAAHADTPSGSTLYVSSGTSSQCSDSAGSGTQATPYCTIEAAVNAASPGQTVYIEPGNYPATTITHSGTAAAPINIVGAPDYRHGSFHQAWIGYLATGVSLTVSGSSYLNFEDIGVETGPTGTVSVSGSSHITFDDTTFGYGVALNAPLAEITGSSQAITIGHSYLVESHTPAVVVNGGSAGTVISTDYLTSTDSVAVSLDDAPGAVVTSNTVRAYCKSGLSLGAASTAAVIENNMFTDSADACPNGSSPQISVDPAASPTATEDYNTLAVTGTQPYYDWGGADYATIAQFAAATGQGAHDTVYKNTYTPVDSANSAAPGESTTDLLGNPRIDLASVANTGSGPESYFDRGAFEIVSPLQSAAFLASASQAPTGSPVTFTAKGFTGLADGLSYGFDFGDGTTQTTANSSLSHTYTQVGTYTATLTVSGVTGVIKKSTLQLAVVPPAPFVAAMSVAAAGTMSAVATNKSTDAWDVTSYTVDFGDGSTPMQAVASTPSVTHSYKKLGTYPIKITATDSQGNTATTSQQFTTAGSEYTAYGPVRILDTRHGIGGVTTPLGANATLRLKIGGTGAIPANVSAVALNLTVTNPSGTGYITAYPDGQAKPQTSNIDYSPGLTKASSVLVGVGSGGEIDLYNGSSGTADLIADVTGYFTATTADGYTPLYPARILDTRSGLGTGGTKSSVGAGKTLTLTVAGTDSGSLPASGVNAVALNLTAVNEATGGYVTAYPDGAATRPLASSLDFAAGQTVPNTVIVPVGADGKIDLYNGSGGTIDLIADVQGYFSAGSPDAYLPVAPARLYDSRTSGGPLTNGNGPYLQPLGPNPAINGTLSTAAFVYNVTITQPTGSGFAVVYPGYGPIPQTSNVNFAAGQTNANTAIAQAGANYTPDNTFTIKFNAPSGNSAQLIVDLFGYFSAE